MVQGDAGAFAQTGRVGIKGQPIDAQALADLVEIDVAGASDGLVQIDRPMPSSSPAAIGPVAETIVARAENRLVRGDHPFLQTGQRSEDFIGRGRWVFTLNRLVVQRAVRVFDQGPPLLGAQTGDEIVLVECGAAGQRQDFAVLRIDRHDGTGLAGHERFRPFLQRMIDGQVNAAAAAGVDGMQHAHHLAVGVDFDLPPAPFATQVLFQGFFDAELPDLVAHAQIGVSGALQFGRVHLADVTQQVGREVGENIVAQTPDLDVDPREVVAMAFNGGQDITADVPFDQNRFEGAHPRFRFDFLNQTLDRHTGKRGQALEGLIQRAGIL